MKICDICKTNQSSYGTTVIANKFGEIQNIDTCSKCYKLLSQKEYKYRYLAYQETINEVTGQQDAIKWFQRFKFVK